MKVILMAKYAPNALKGLIGGSDRHAAVKALMDAIGGTADSIVFTGGEYDVVVNIEVSDQVKLLGLVLAIKASGAFEKAEYLEEIEIEKVIEVARKAAQSYSPAG